MKTTTFAPMKVGTNQHLLPSGVKAANDGKYHYWQCSVSGLETFAKPDYWVKIMAKYGSEANLVKTYVCQKAQRLLDVGKTPAEVVVLLANPKAIRKEKKQKLVTKKMEKEAIRAQKQEVKRIKAERKALTKKVRFKGLKSFAIGSVEVAVTEDTGSIKVEKVPVYPWQNELNYFGNGERTIISVAEATKESCARPAINLDSECRGCPFHADCKCSARFSEEDWKKPRSKSEVKVKAIKSFGD